MENSRAQAALSLVVGTASSFGIAMASTAVVARLYRPAAFGEFAEFMAWMALPAALGTLRIADAIPLTKSSDAEHRMIHGGLEILLLIATLGGVIAIIIPGGSDGVSFTAPWWIFSLGFTFVAASGITRIAIMLATKHGWFRWIATLSTALPLGTFIGQLIVWRLGGMLVEGFVLGAVLAASPAAFMLVRHGPSGRAWPLATRSVLAEYPEFARLAVPFAVIDTLRARAPYLIAGLPSSGVDAAQIGCIQQADRVSGWPRMGLSAILRPLFQHAAARDHVRAAAQATDITVRMLVVASGPVTWAVLNASLVIRVALGPGWEGAVMPLQLLLAPAVIFFAADFTDRLFDMHRRQGVLLIIGLSAGIATIVGSVLFTLIQPSLLGLVFSLGCVMVAYSMAAIFYIAKLGRVDWKPYVRLAPLLVLSAAVVAAVQVLFEYAAPSLGGSASALLALLLAALTWKVQLPKSPQRVV